VDMSALKCLDSKRGLSWAGEMWTVTHMQRAYALTVGNVMLSTDIDLSLLPFYSFLLPV